MSRTTPALVAGIIQIEAGVDVQPFIDAANQLATDVCGSSGYSDQKMELIERWLSAHLYTIFDNQIRLAKAGTVSVAYQYKIDYGLANSMYGQQVMLLDTLGNFAKLSNANKTQRKVKVSINYVGTNAPRNGSVSGGWPQLTIVL